MKGSMRAYARHRAELGLDGQTVEGVSRAVDSNRISKDPDGQIDFEKADAEWAANTKPSVNNRTTRHREAVRKPVAAVKAPPQTNTAQNQQSASGFAQARALREGFMAGLAQLEFKRRSGDLLPKSEVKQSLSNLVATTRMRLLGVGSKLAPHVALESDTAVCQSLIDAEMHEALAELSQWHFEE